MHIEPSAILKFQGAIIEGLKRVNRWDDIQTAHYIRTADNAGRLREIAGGLVSALIP